VPQPQIDQFRRQLREKFPQAHGMRAEVSPVAGRDFHTPEAFPAGQLTEVIPAAAQAGLSLLVAALLGNPAEPCSQPELVLIDGADGLDPDSFTAFACSRLLWVRCSDTAEVLRATELILRDGNLAFVLLDLTGIALRSLQAIPATAWWRLKPLVAQAGLRLVVLSPQPLIPCAGLRLSLAADLTLADLHRPRAELITRLNAKPQRLRHVT
jgi:hypothetical protein